jgi:hypothetical protein
MTPAQKKDLIYNDISSSIKKYHNRRFSEVYWAIYEETKGILLSHGIQKSLLPSINISVDPKDGVLTVKLTNWPTPTPLDLN